MFKHESIQRIPEIENNIIERYYSLGNRAPIFEQDTLSIKMPNQNNRELSMNFLNTIIVAGYILNIRMIKYLVCSAQKEDKSHIKLNLMTSTT